MTDAILPYRFVFRRGTAAEWTSVNEVLRLGEPGIESDTGTADGKRKFKIGDGATAWNDLPYFKPGAIDWGDITGTLADQIDLRDALAAKVSSLVAGNHINVDASDPDNPVVAVTGLSAGAGYAEGASFPALPGLNDKFYRTDRNLLCYYDGTRWLTCQVYSVQLASVNPGSLSASASWSFAPDQAGIFVTSVQASIRVPGTNDSSNYWDVQFQSHDGASATNLPTLTTKGLSFTSPNLFRLLSAPANTPISSVTLIVNYTKVGSPGIVYNASRVNYRLIIA
jgi:hypothetical protein